MNKLSVIAQWNIIQQMEQVTAMTTGSNRGERQQQNIK